MDYTPIQDLTAADCRIVEVQLKEIVDTWQCRYGTFDIRFACFHNGTNISPSYSCGWRYCELFQKCISLSWDYEKRILRRNSRRCKLDYYWKVALSTGGTSNVAGAVGNTGAVIALACVFGWEASAATSPPTPWHIGASVLKEVGGVLAWAGIPSASVWPALDDRVFTILEKIGSRTNLDGKKFSWWFRGLGRPESLT